MPTFSEHAEFVRSNPYMHWYIIQSDHAFLGAIYLTHAREIGLGILREHQRQGYGRAAVEELVRLHPGKFLANVNPKNEPSIAFWKAMGFELKQVVYSYAA
jgi:RimJ/RimL family protein N-acetyltransferase